MTLPPMNKPGPGTPPGETGENPEWQQILNELDATRKLRQWLSKAPRRFLNWLENGDLILLLIIVSIWNIATIFTAYYPPAVAASMAILIDIAIYQNIIAAIKKNQGNIIHHIITWSIFLLSLAYSIYLHLQFYISWLFTPLQNGIVYATLIPFSIFGIAWRMYVKENHEESTNESAETNREESGSTDIEKSAESIAGLIAKNGRENQPIPPRKKPRKTTRNQTRKSTKKIVKTKDGICLVCGAKKADFKSTAWAGHFRDEKHRKWNGENA